MGRTKIIIYPGQLIHAILTFEQEVTDKHYAYIDEEEEWYFTDSTYAVDLDRYIVKNNTIFSKPRVNVLWGGSVGSNAQISFMCDKDMEDFMEELNDLQARGCMIVLDSERLDIL